MKIAIKANPNRGKEIISLLESLGGINERNWIGDGDIDLYYIDKDNKIQYNYVPKDYKVYTLEEFEEEFPFKIGDLCIYYSDILDEHITVKILGMTIKDGCIMYEIVHEDITMEHSYIYKERRTLKPYKEMKEERNITLTLEKAQEWYKKGGELKEVALQAFSEKELNPLPRSWEEYTDKMALIRVSTDRLPLSSLPEKYTALYKLEQLRDCWRQGWEPDWLDHNTKKYVIRGWRDKSSIEITYVIHAFLSFPTYELALEFLECFRDLIEKAGDLI